MLIFNILNFEDKLSLNFIVDFICQKEKGD